MLQIWCGVVCSVQQCSNRKMGRHSLNFLYSPLTPFSMVLALTRYAQNTYTIELAQNPVIYLGNQRPFAVGWGTKKWEPQQLVSSVGASKLWPFMPQTRGAAFPGANQTEIAPAAHTHHMLQGSIFQWWRILTPETQLMPAILQYTRSRIPTGFLFSHPTTVHCDLLHHRFCGFLQQQQSQTQTQQCCRSSTTGRGLDKSIHPIRRQGCNNRRLYFQKTTTGDSWCKQW